MQVNFQNASRRNPLVGIFSQELLNKENVVHHFPILKKSRLGLTNNNLQHQGYTVCQNPRHNLVQQVVATDWSKVIHLGSLVCLRDESKMT